MKYEILFSGKNKKNISKCHLLNFLPSIRNQMNVCCNTDPSLYWVHFSEDSKYIIWPASVAQLDAPSDWRPGGRGFNPRRGRQHSFVVIDHEIFSTVIPSLPLIQE